MSTLSGSSTLAQIRTSYGDNASYYEDGSVSKAKAFVTACRLLLINMPTSASHGREKTDFEVELIQKEMKAARDWIASNETDSGNQEGGSKYVDFTDSRS